MVFLKKFCADGFKTFANPIELSFNDSVVGVVGPNGSGKSNIIDAIKWVLGEKSNKTLRSHVGTDVVFHGSKDRDASEYAQVSLTFDNSQHKINYDGDEITITRKLIRATGANEYYINNEQCRLRDINEIFLDTGLSKGSLGIISQGTIQWFVEAKPEERRKIFEDASGIGMYVKKKQEALADLEKAANNLNRVDDHVGILERNIRQLNKQVEKVQQFAEKKKTLTDLELTLLVKDINFYQAKLNEVSVIIQDCRAKIATNIPEQEVIRKQIQTAKEKTTISDQEVEQYNQELAQLIEKINRCEIRKNALESNLNNDLSSDNLEKKIKAYQQIIRSTKFDLESSQKAFDQYQNDVQMLTNVCEEMNVKLSNLSSKISTDSNQINDLNYQLKYVEDNIHNRYSHDIGVKAILENKNILPGIMGCVQDFLKVDSKYEKAISVALGRTLNYVVTETENDAKYAIDFLKKNKTGRATFLPLSMVRAKEIRPEHAEVLNQLDGFINTGDKLIDFRPEFATLFKMFLGRTIIADDLNNAINISKYVKSMYPVVTLDGETISIGGAIAGGYIRKNAVSSFNLEEKKQELISKIKALSDELTQTRIAYNELKGTITDTSTKLNEKKILVSSYEEKIKNYQDSLHRYEAEYQAVAQRLDPDSETNSQQLDLNQELVDLTLQKDQLNEKLNVARTSKLNNRQIFEDYLARQEEIRELLDKLNGELARNENDATKCEFAIKNAKERINNEYKMTIEFACENYTKELTMSENQAREIVTKLRYELDQLGSLNMSAVDELETKKKEYDELIVKQTELKNAKDKIDAIIQQLDKKARDSFQETIDRVNSNLPDIFKYLFGGGTCSVSYTNSDDILISGIDVLANPPGKKVTNLNLLSGGEKSLVALSVLFAILQCHSFPLVILDEAESALDPANVERFANIIQRHSDNTQFIVVTHRPGTMERCDNLLGATMQIKGITSIYNVSLAVAKKEFGLATTSDKE